MKRLILFFFIINSTLFAQLIEENFDYGSTETDLVTASSNVWSNHSGGTGTLDVQYISSGLSYLGYVSSGIGGAASISNSRTGDNNRAFTSQSSGSIYLSALVNVFSATSTTAGEYILHFGSTGTHYCKLYIRKDSVNLRFGLAKSSESATFSNNNYVFNTTYLVVLKYTFNSSAQDDRTDLWVISSGVPSTEDDAGTATIPNITAATTDASSISTISIRQGIVAHSAKIDGIRVATSWSQAPLPVELTSFTRNIVGKKVKLYWQTATEVNNYGFEVQRLAVSNQLLANSKELNANGWSKIGFVNGHGNSNSPKKYSFTDEPFGRKEFKYRLKQIDFDGKFEYSDEVTAVFEDVTTFELEQNYPNPFNPSTKISYTIPQRSNVKLRVYNMLAQMEAELVNESQEAGHYQVIFNGSNLPSGTYFYKLEAGKFVDVKKFLLVK